MEPWERHTLPQRVLAEPGRQTIFGESDAKTALFLTHCGQTESVDVIIGVISGGLGGRPDPKRFGHGDGPPTS